MIFENNKVKDIKIAYIGGGSRGWSWTLMNELTIADDVSGTVALYDIDFEAAKNNVLIGKHFSNASEAKSYWNFEAVETIDEALIGADFVIISILPGTFDEMYSDVHTPEKFGIYQSVGDTVGPLLLTRSKKCGNTVQEMFGSDKTVCGKNYKCNLIPINNDNVRVCFNAVFENENDRFETMVCDFASGSNDFVGENCDLFNIWF